jgi:hypothetical protein
MRYRYNPDADYDYPYENPSVAHAEAESKRIMAVVQHVRDRLERKEVERVFRKAQENKQLKGLISAALELFKPVGLSKRALEVVSTMLSGPEYFDKVGIDDLYYLDEVGAEELLMGGSLSGQDPGVVVSDTKTIVPLGERSYHRGRGRRKHQIARKAFLKSVWPYVTDSDVRVAVEILTGEGVEFLRKVKMTNKEWMALRDPDASIWRWKKGVIRGRDEFASAHATRTEDALVLRVNIGEVMTVLRGMDFAPDDVVYRYDGTNNSIGGASARGFYVAKLRPAQLTLEGMSPPVGLGICVGGEHYRERVEEGKMDIYGIRTPAGKPKFTIEVRLPEQRVKQVKGKANRIPGFDPDEAVFKGEAGVDDVRAVVEFLVNHLNMPTRADAYDPLLRKISRLRALTAQLGGEAHAQAIEEIGDLRPGLLAMQRIGIDPFAPPVKGQTWEAASAAKERVFAEVNELWDSAANEPDERRRRELLDQADALRRQLRQMRQMPPALDQMQGAMRENPDPLAYTDPEVAALARAAYAQPMGGMWTYDDDLYDDDDEGEE